jgi:hypothetical protein
MRDRNKLLWSELTREERAEEKREFLEDYARECGGEPKDYQMQWEMHLNQEGWESRDQRILMERDREFDLMKHQEEQERREEYDRRHPSTSCTCSVCRCCGLSDMEEL